MPQDEEMILDKLEDFFASPDFTSTIGDFLEASTARFQFYDLGAEQPLEHFACYEAYQRVVEQVIEGFLAKEGWTAEGLVEAATACQAAGNSSALTSVDYLMATTEFSHFVQLVSDFASLAQWGGDGEVGSRVCLSARSVCPTLAPLPQLLENELEDEGQASDEDPELSGTAEPKDSGGSSSSSSSRPSKDAARDEKGAPAKGVGFVGAQGYWEGVEGAQAKGSSDNPGLGKPRGAKGGSTEPRAVRK